MTEATPYNMTAFAPLGGGQGIRITATVTTGSASIPGFAGGVDEAGRRRVSVSNSGLVSVYIAIGNSGVTASTSSYEILPLTKEILTPPNIGTQGLYIAAITASGSAPINVCAGTGT